MNDKELLELAAKAAGIGIMPCTCSTHPFKHDGLTSGLRGHWNPLTDDGDAFRLAVGLDLTIQQNFGGVYCYNSPDYPNKPSGMIEVYESKRSTDPYAATRRAIVRAAAEIGLGIAQPETTSGLPDDDYYQTMADAHELGSRK